MDKFESEDVLDMFCIITSHLQWDQCGVDSFYDLENIRNIMASGKDLTESELQSAYNIIQSTRYYFNAHIDDPRFSTSFKMDATRFGIYYNAFIAMYPVQDLKSVKNEHGACYIATAVYGSYFNPKVMALRFFRDEYLQKSLLGRKLIIIYYRYSPRYAAKLKDAKYINLIIRKFLDTFVSLIRLIWGFEYPDQNNSQ